MKKGGLRLFLFPTGPNLYKKPVGGRGEHQMRWSMLGLGVKVHFCLAGRLQWTWRLKRSPEEQQQSKPCVLYPQWLLRRLSQTQRWLLVGGVSRGGGRKGSQAMYTENLVLRIKLTLISPRGYCSNTQWHKHWGPIQTHDALSAIPKSNRLWKPKVFT